MKLKFTKSARLLPFVLLCAAPFGCGPKTGSEKQTDQKAEEETPKSTLPEGLTAEEAAKVVAKVGERTITVGDVTRQINRLSPYIRRRWAAPEKRKEFLDKLIRVELLSQEAERLGLADDPEVQRTVKQVMVRLMIKNDLEKELFPNQVDEKILKEEYDKEKDKYYRPAQVRASQIVLKNRAEAEKLLAELQKKAADARLFRQKARELSIDKTTGERGGDIGYFSQPGQRRDDEPEVPKAVAEAAFAISNSGDLAKEIIQTDQGFHIVKLTNKRAEMNRSFESVKRMIENRLLRDKRREAMDEFIEGLRKNSKIELFEQNMAKLNFKEVPGEQPAAPPTMVKPQQEKLNPKMQIKNQQPDKEQKSESK